MILLFGKFSKKSQETEIEIGPYRLYVAKEFLKKKDSTSIKKFSREKEVLQKKMEHRSLKSSCSKISVERQTERQTDRKTDGQKDRQKDRQTERLTERQLKQIRMRHLFAKTTTTTETT